MNVAELIEILQDMNPEAEVKLAQQPNWPLAYSIGGIVPDESNSIVWIGEGRQDDDPYGVPRDVFN